MTDIVRIHTPNLAPLLQSIRRWKIPASTRAELLRFAEDLALGKVNRQELSYRYGWRFSSNMPDIYISRAGMENHELDEKFTQTECSPGRVGIAAEATGTGRRDCAPNSLNSADAPEEERKPWPPIFTNSLLRLTRTSTARQRRDDTCGESWRAVKPTRQKHTRARQQLPD
jgi:hypothetical protein